VVAPLSEVGEYGGNLSVGIPSAWSWFGDPQSAVGPETLMRLASDYTGVVPNIVRSWDWEPDDKTVVMQNRVCSVIAWGEQPTMQPYVRITSNPQSHTLERNAYYWKVDPSGCTGTCPTASAARSRSHARRERLRDRGGDEAGAGEQEPGQRAHRGRARLRRHPLPAHHPEATRCNLLPAVG